MPSSLVRLVPVFGVALVTAAVAQTPAASDSAATAAARAKSLPLIATRNLAFTATEGTWISLDLSPDGRTIVFELLGDLYTMPVGGGAATRITSGQPYDMQPRFSPDGRSLVFVSDRDGSENLWLADADGGNPRPLTTGERENYVSPAWTPDGRYIFATKGTQLWLWHTDGGSGIQISPKPAATGPQTSSYLGPAFGPDPRYLWLNIRGLPTLPLAAADHDEAEDTSPRSARSSPRLLGAYQVGQLDRETGRVMVRTHELEGAFRPVASPDGRWLVYATRFDARPALKLLDLTTGDDRWLVMDVARDDHQGGGSRDRDLYPGSAFTPDSRALITSFGGKIRRVEIPSGAAIEIPFSARVDLPMGPLVKFDYPIDDTTLLVSQIRGARPSPDGRRLAFIALDRLWIADLPPGSGGATQPTPAVIRSARRLTTATIVEHGPTWSPDGRYLAYVTWSDSSGGDIYRVAADGSARPERLSPASAFFDKLAYSRDGQRLLAVRGSRLHRLKTLEDFGSHSGASELEYVWLPAAGGPIHRIAFVGAGTTQEGRNVPHIGPDPNRFYVWAGAEGLISMRFDGSDSKPVVKVTGPNRPGFFPGAPPTPAVPDEVILSPDGRRAIARVSRNVWLVTVPQGGGGEAPVVSVMSPSAMPAQRLTTVGGDFVGWRLDGRVAHYAIGRSYFQHEVALADSLWQDSVRVARAREAGGGAPRADSTSRATIGYHPHRVVVEITARKDRPGGTVALTNARLLTMRGNEVIERGDVVVRDNRIVAVGQSGQVGIPADARRVDLAGKTILPGYVDIHAHTWVAWGVHRQQVSQFLAQLAYGVTTQRDPQTSSEDVVSYSDLMETGAMIGPRLYSTGPGIFADDLIKSLDDARDVLRRYADHYHTKTIKQYLAGDRKVRQWVITAARELGLTPTTEGGANFTMNLTLMQDGYAGLEHALPISPLFEDVVQLHRASGLTYTPTLIVAYGGPIGRDYYLSRTNVEQDSRLRFFTPHDELDKWKSVTWHRDDQYVHTLHAGHLARMYAAGGRLGLGSHGEVQGLGVHWELWMMASGGLQPLDALKMATLHSADAVGLAGDIGSIEPGKLADLQVLDQNPLVRLENSTTIRYVMKNGRLYDASNLTEIWPRQRPLEPRWWARLEPER
ncbi:MAG: amidohydrolase family protein [Gemmatimonadetes bacterium]|nr:amidohydrolase family protein [Gemmatimonadota bacterium]